MKIIFKVALIFFLGMTISNAQSKKKMITGGIKAPMKTQVSTPAQSATDGIFAEINSTKGVMLLKLEYQKAPVTVANFIALAEGTNTAVGEKFKGKHFYDGLKFHRVIKDFMIQGGDPEGNGSSGPGYAFKDEFDSSLIFDKGGVLAMANSGPKTNGSQFFITHKETPWLNNKHSIFGSIVSGMDVVNKIEQNDVITKIVIIRKGADAKKFDAAKVFSDYFANKGNDDAKQAAVDAENKRKLVEAEAEKKKEYTAKYGSIMTAKMNSLSKIKATSTKTESGLQYAITQKGTGKKPADGTNILIHYAGFLEDGSLFDSSYEEINKLYGKYDENRAKANGYQPFPFVAGKKDGLIPGFIEGLSQMSIGDKATVFIPSKLGYGERGAGTVIPPNSNIIFEIEMLEAPAKIETTATPK